MSQLQEEIPRQALASALGISRSGLYAEATKPRRPRRLQDDQLAKALIEIFERSRRTYGSPRLRAALQQRGQRHGKNRVWRLMRQLGLRARQKRKFRRSRTATNPTPRVAANWLPKVPHPDQPDRIWLSDITYIPTAEGWAYLSVVLDACSRRIVGWALADHLQDSLVTEALKRALNDRRPPLGLLHHSDRGTQYTSSRLQRLLHDSGITPSMSRPGNCYDNAMAESFFATLKTECFGAAQPPSRAAARSMIFDYIEAFYNPRRLHSALGYRSPVEFEKQLLALHGN